MSTGVSPLLHLQAGVAELEYLRSDLPAQVHFVGAPAEPAPEVPMPAWWRDVDAKRVPIVHVTQGTVADARLTDLVVPTRCALADAEVVVVATIGRNDLVGLGSSRIVLSSPMPGAGRHLVRPWRRPEVECWD